MVVKYLVISGLTLTSMGGNNLFNSVVIIALLGTTKFGTFCPKALWGRHKVGYQKLLWVALCI